MRHLYARARLITTLTTKGMHSLGRCRLWRIDPRTELLSVDTGKLYSLELENPQG
jgi:hypothetical protein